MKKMVFCLVLPLLMLAVSTYGQRENPRRLPREQQREAHYHERSAERSERKAKTNDRKKKHYHKEAEKMRWKLRGSRNRNSYRLQKLNQYEKKEEEAAAKSKKQKAAARSERRKQQRAIERKR